MLRKKKVNSSALSIPAGLGVGLLICLVITIAGAAITAWLVSSEKIGEGNTGYAAMMILAVSSSVGAFVSSCLVKRLRLQVCLLMGVCYYLSLIAMTALVFGGQYQGMGVSAIVVMGFCTIVAFIPSGKRGSGIKRKTLHR